MMMALRNQSTPSYGAVSRITQNDDEEEQQGETQGGHSTENKFSIHSLFPNFGRHYQQELQRLEKAEVEENVLTTIKIDSSLT